MRYNDRIHEIHNHKADLARRIALHRERVQRELARRQSQPVRYTTVPVRQPRLW